MMEQDLEKVLNQIVNLLISMEKKLESIETRVKKYEPKKDKKRVLRG